MHENISLRGLRQLLVKFDEDGKLAEGKHWKIANGGYDLWWVLYYDDIAVVECHASGKYCNFRELGELRSCGIYSEADFLRVCKTICEIYGDCFVAKQEETTK